MDTLIHNDQPAPSFSLPSLDGTVHHLEELRGQVAVLNFWSAECPHADRTDRELLVYLRTWSDQVSLWSIASNANEPTELLRQVSNERGLPLVLHDVKQQVADLYGAQTTPHFFVIDPDGILRYQGAFDDVTLRKREPSRWYLKEAVGTVLEGLQPNPAQSPPYGCAIVRYALDR
jgi:peroxiredoxin